MLSSPIHSNATRNLPFYYLSTTFKIISAEACLHNVFAHTSLGSSPLLSSGPSRFPSDLLSSLIILRIIQKPVPASCPPPWPFPNKSSSTQLNQSNFQFLFCVIIKSGGARENVCVSLQLFFPSFFHSSFSFSVSAFVNFDVFFFIVSV